MMSQVCRTQDEVLTTFEHWKAAMIERDGSHEGTPWLSTPPWLRGREPPPTPDRWRPSRRVAGRSSHLSVTARYHRLGIEPLDQFPTGNVLVRPQSDRTEVTDHLGIAVAIEVGDGDAVSRQGG